MIVLIVALAATGGLFAQTPKKKPAEIPTEKAAPESLDDELLRDLAAPPMLLNDGKKTPTPKPAPAGEDVGEKVNPLQRIGQRMRVAQRRIGQRNISTETRRIQKTILDELDLLIEQTQKAGSSGAKQTSGRGGKDKGAQAGQAGTQAGRGAAAEANQDRPSTGGGGTGGPDGMSMGTRVIDEVWGHLPERVRAVMRGTGSGQFVRKYELLIERYYQRLTEQLMVPNTR